MKQLTNSFSGLIFNLLIISIFILPNLQIFGFSFGIYDLLFIFIILDILLSFKNITSVEKIVFIFVVFSFIVLLIQQVINNYFDSGSFLRLWRILYGPFICLFAKKHQIFLFENKRYSFFVILALINSILGLLIFASQYTGFGIQETFIFRGNVMYRNGGIFGEANSYAVFIVSVFFLLLYFYSKNRKLKFVFFTTEFLILINLLLTDSRTGVFVFLIGFIVVLFKAKISVLKKITVVFVSMILVLSFYLINMDFRQFIEQRFSISQYNNISQFSSGRLTLWQNSFITWFQSGIANVVFGLGFRYTNSQVLNITDNMYLNLFYGCGFVRLFLYLLLLILMLKTSFVSSFISKVFFVEFIIFIVSGFTLDILTATRVYILYWLVFSANKEIIKLQKFGRQIEVKSKKYMEAK